MTSFSNGETGHKGGTQGDEGTFYLDIEGKIAAVDTATSLSSNYAFAVDADLSTGFEKNLQIKVYTKDGETLILTSGEKIRCQGDG